MNTAQSVQTGVGPDENAYVVFSSGLGRAGNAEPHAAPGVDIAMERLKENTSRKERFLYSKNVDSGNSLKSVSNGESVDSSRLPDGLVSIHKARHAAVGEFLGVVAHKCRQPLNALAMIIHNMVDAWKFGELNDELMERSELRAVEQINLLTRTIDDLRSFLDPDTTTESFSPVESVKLVVSQMSSWFSGSSVITVKELDKAYHSYRTAGCQHAFERVIVNLLCNANDAIEERQRNSRSLSESLITVILTCSDQHIVISVEDTGGGIENSQLARVFEPYFTTKQKGAGFGMGLYLSKLVIENSMNGSLLFENIPDGARFSIFLPVLPQERITT